MKAQGDAKQVGEVPPTKVLSSVMTYISHVCCFSFRTTDCKLVSKQVDHDVQVVLFLPSSVNVGSLQGGVVASTPPAHSEEILPIPCTNAKAPVDGSWLDPFSWMLKMKQSPGMSPCLILSPFLCLLLSQRVTTISWHRLSTGNTCSSH